MSEAQVGQIGWLDITAENAADLAEFYADVVGWRIENTSMGEYDDYTMLAGEAGDAVAGVCHARGANAGVPPVWMAYVNVANLDRSMECCIAKNGAVVHGPLPLAGGRVAVIRDPAGAHLALYQAKDED